jgi:hypothetical protein
VRYGSSLTWSSPIIVILLRTLASQRYTTPIALQVPLWAIPRAVAAECISAGTDAEQFSENDGNRSCGTLRDQSPRAVVGNYATVAVHAQQSVLSLSTKKRDHHLLLKGMFLSFIDIQIKTAGE